MFTTGSANTRVTSGSVKSSVGMTIVYRIFAPRPMPPATKPQTAFIKRKNRVQKAKLTGAARIAAEKRFVKGLGYVRADAIPCRSKAKSVKRASAGSVADLERVCAAMMSQDSVVYVGAGSVESSGSSRPGLYEVPRFPSTFNS
ncbi:hypothetical protein FRC08_016722 [Ceratobasidium sp. 394]|nr:hypothetical protein FRC08_016722 [Ceratobasidium sp. 394]